MNKFLILFLSVFSLSFAMNTNNNANANMFNKFKKGFYFEKYKTAQEAKVALLELHPIGSDVEGLFKTLEGAGAEVREMEEREIKNVKRNLNVVWIKSYSYKM